MVKQNVFQENWYEKVRDYTLQLVNIRSVSPGAGEILVAQKVLELLCEGGREAIYTTYGLDPIKDDLYSRSNAYAFLQGRSTHALVLLGHIDTVDTQDYGPLEPWALDPETLTTKQDILGELVPGLQEDLREHPNDWMFGRGAIDMKSGVAANIALMRRLTEDARTSSLPFSVVFLATPDEENESAGVLQAVHFLLQLRETYGLDYVGAINTDYTTSRYPGDPHRYVYTGTIGKLLPSFLVIGREAHVGEPFDGVDANLLAAELIRRCSMNNDLCDSVNGQVTAPPVTLRASDLKAHYDVQLPFAAYFYLNVLTFKTLPQELLERLRVLSSEAMNEVLARIDECEHRWMQASDESARKQQVHARKGSVLTYGELYADTVQLLGKEQVEAEMAAEWNRWPAELDKRERSLHLTYHLWRLSRKSGPAIALYYSPPYYPHVAPTPCALHRALASVVEAHADIGLVQEKYYSYISDMSYLRLDPGADLSALKANMPVWQEPGVLQRPGSYSLPLEAISQLHLPITNFGPYGKGVHQRGERALMSYSFGILPQLLYETVEKLAQLLQEEEGN